MRTSGRTAIIALAAMFGLNAQPSQASNIVADLDQVAIVMKKAGYQAELGSNLGERFLTAELDGYKFMVLPYGCDDTKRNCKSLQFFIAFNPESSPSLEAINAYARENRWGRVYLDKDGDPALEFDLDLEKGGMSEDLFLDNVAYWEAIVQAYAKFVFGER